jgi:hypothetical protein
MNRREVLPINQPLRNHGRQKARQVADLEMRNRPLRTHPVDRWFGNTQKFS